MATNSNGYKAQYKTSAGSPWQTKLSGTEHSALQAKQRLEGSYAFTRVIDPDGRVVC